MSSQNIEVLNYLKANNKWSSSVSLNAKTKYSGDSSGYVTFINITFIRDNNRCQWKGTSISKTSEGKIVEEAMSIRYIIMNGEQYLIAIGADLNTFRRAFIYQTDYKATQTGSLEDPNMGRALWGRMYGSNGFDIYELIEQCPNVRYEKSDSLIDGLECFEIEGTCKYGKIKIVFCPQKGYFPLKWEITKEPGDYFDSKLLSVKHWKVAFQAKEVKNVDGFYIPLKGRMQNDVVSKEDKITKLSYDCELSNIQISPDFKAIKAFEFDLPPNVPVTLVTAP